jgi:hypothetical protein
MCEYPTQITEANSSTDVALNTILLTVLYTFFHWIDFKPRLFRCCRFAGSEHCVQFPRGEVISVQIPIMTGCWYDRRIMGVELHSEEEGKGSSCSWMLNFHEKCIHDICTPNTAVLCSKKGAVHIYIPVRLIPACNAVLISFAGGLSADRQLLFAMDTEHSASTKMFTIEFQSTTCMVHRVKTPLAKQLLCFRWAVGHSIFRQAFLRTRRVRTARAEILNAWFRRFVYNTKPSFGAHQPTPCY